MAGFADYLSNFGSNFQRGLGVLGQGVQSLPGDFSAGIQTLRQSPDPAADMLVGAGQFLGAGGKEGLKQFGDLNPGTSLYRGTRYVSGLDPQGKMANDLMNLGVNPRVAGGIGAGADFAGQLGSPSSVARTAVQPLTNPSGLSDTAKRLAQQAAYVQGQPIPQFAPPLQGLGTAARKFAGASEGTGARVAADLVPVENEVTMIRGADSASPALSGRVPQTAAEESALAERMQAFADRGKQAAQLGNKVEGSYTPAIPGGPGYLMTSGGPNEANTFGHEMAHALVDTAVRGGPQTINALPFYLRPVARMASSDVAGIRGLSEFANEAVAHGRGPAYAALEAGAPYPNALMKGLLGTAKFALSGNKAGMYGPQYIALDPTSSLAEAAHRFAAEGLPPIAAGAAAYGAGRQLWDQ